MRGGDETHVHLYWRRGADLLEFALLNQPQKFDLEFTWHLPDFVEKQRSAIGHLDLSRFVSYGARE